jgi:predicted DNA-binding protein with PD1-like motif
VKSSGTSFHAIRLNPGQDLKGEIDAYATTHKIEAGFIVTCVGSLTKFNLRFADQPGGTQGEGHFEIVSLTGTVSIHGSHLHMSVSDERGKTTGGHVLEGNVIYTTAEIVLGESSDLIFTREVDGTTPWKELIIRKK